MCNPPIVACPSRGRRMTRYDSYTLEAVGREATRCAPVERLAE